MAGDKRMGGEFAQVYGTPGETGVQERDRKKVAVQHTWNLGEIYPDREAWKQARQDLVSRLPEIEQYRGRLAESAATLLGCLELVADLGKEYTRLYCYASMYSDQDTRDALYLGMEQEIGQLGSEFGAKTAFIEPEILAIDRTQIEAFFAAQPGLELHRHNLQDTLRRKAHTGTEGEEKILADSGLIADSPNSIYSIFSDADFPCPMVNLSTGAAVKLDKVAFALHKAAPDREDRKLVFSTYFGKLNEFRRTFGTQLYAEVKKNMFYARARNYRSCLERALDGSNIPAAVYHGLIENVHTHLPTFHRYLDLRRRILGGERLHYYDLYAPLVGEMDRHYTIQQAQQHVLASLKPLGEEYITVAKRCFAERWMDVFPTEGKRSGAYSNGSVYDVHPYILLNYNGKYDDISTLTHELGHTMHSYLTNRAQAYQNSHYSIFVAEVASTFNEALLLEYMLGVIDDDRLRLSLLGNFLDGIRGTVFRQTQFAEYELSIHEKAERGESLTGESLSELYDTMTKRYYGHEKGVCEVDDEIAVEWAHIPHFYYNFYVYQYATSFTASSALSEQVLAGDRDAARRYLELLQEGGSDYPVDLLKKAGIDMTTSLPFDLTMQKMNRVMDEMEMVLKKIN
jgi:oligoendopeptidase F